MAGLKIIPIMLVSLVITIGVQWDSSAGELIPWQAPVTGKKSSFDYRLFEAKIRSLQKMQKKVVIADVREGLEKKLLDAKNASELQHYEKLIGIVDTYIDRNAPAH